MPSSRSQANVFAKEQGLRDVQGGMKQTKMPKYGGLLRARQRQCQPHKDDSDYELERVESIKGATNPQYSKEKNHRVHANKKIHRSSHQVYKLFC
jgi:hypothetical protein